VSDDAYDPDAPVDSDSLTDNENNILDTFDETDDEIADQHLDQSEDLFERFERSYRARRIRELVKAPLPRGKRRDKKKRGAISGG